MLLSCLTTAAWAAIGETPAQGASQAPKLGWGDAAELSVVVTHGNSETETFGFRNSLTWRSELSDLRLTMDAIHANSADDRFALLEPGLTFLPGEQPPAGSSTAVEPELELDVERYFVEGRYDRKISTHLTWVGGGRWERNEDAGILNRYIAFAGIGHTWRDDERLKFKSTSALSGTFRQEEEEDPEKENSFLGIRLGWQYVQKFGPVATIENNFSSDFSTKDAGDYTLDMTTSLAVNMGKHLALKTSLQWLFNKEPALEEVDLVARVELVDPDGVPGSGDEFFRTVTTGGIEIEFGETNIRKEDFDSIFRTSLVVNF